MIYFKKTYCDEALRQTKEYRDLLDVWHDLEKIQSLIDEINFADKSRFGIVGDSLFQRAKALDSQMRQKYPMIETMLNAANRRIGYRTTMRPTPQMQVCDQVVSDLVQDWYGILCDTAIKKKIITNANRVDEPAYKRTTRAFQSVVDGGADDTVGGITVSVIFDYQAKRFIYGWERAFYTSKPQIVQPGGAISFHLSASDGEYSHEIVPIDLQNVLCVVDQMNPRILYSRNFRLDSSDIENPHLSGLMMPMLVKVNEKGEYVRCR